MRSRLKRLLSYFLVCTGCYSVYFLVIMPDTADDLLSNLVDLPANVTTTVVQTLRHSETDTLVNFLQIPKVECNRQMDLMVLIKSTANAFDKRQVQRETWVSKIKELGIPVVFALGKSLNSSVNLLVTIENRQYGDLLQADFTDKYANLSLKTLATFLWEADCKPAKRFFHTDDDCIILSDNFIRFTKQSQLQSDTILGHCWNQSKVVRDPNNTKSFLSNETYPSWYFPKYCSGTGFFLTSDVPAKLLSVLSDKRILKKFGHLDDVLYTGILPELANVTRWHIDNVRIEAKTSIKPCDKQTFAMHGYKPVSVYRHYWNLYAKTMKGCRTTSVGNFALSDKTGIYSLPHYSAAIWTYWPENTLPPAIQLISDSVSCLNSLSFRHFILTPKNVTEFSGEIALTEDPKLKASLVATAILRRFGGFYVEPTAMAKRSFMNLFKRLQGTTDGCLVTHDAKYAGIIGPFKANSTIIGSWINGVVNGGTVVSTSFVDYVIADTLLRTKLGCNDVFDRRTVIQEEMFTDYLSVDSLTNSQISPDEIQQSDDQIGRLYRRCCLPKERKCGRNETSGFVMVPKSN